MMCRHFVLWTLSSCLALPAVAGNGRVDLPLYPSISPDGARIAFSWRGDLWVAPTAGGQATRLSAHPGDDLESAWSPDGSSIAFASLRDGFGNIFLIGADGSNLRQLTTVDRRCVLNGFGVDGEGKPVVLFHGTLEPDVYRDNRPFMVSVEGGDVRRTHDAFGSEQAQSPSGRMLAFSRNGYYDGWERRHYRGAEASELWTWDRTSGAFARRTTWDGNDGRAKWVGEDTLLFMSDRSDRTVHVWRMNLARGEGALERLTIGIEHDVRDFDVTPDGKTMVMMVWDRLYRVDLTRTNAAPVEIDLRASEDEGDRFQMKEIDREVSEAALSPDGKTLALVAYGEVWVRATEEGAPTRRVTDDHARESNLAWSPDGLKLYFTSDRTGVEAIYTAAVARTRQEVKDEFDYATGRKERPKANEKEGESKPDDEGAKSDEGAAAPADAPATEAPDPKKEEKPESGDKPSKKKDEELPPHLKPERWRDAIAFTVDKAFDASGPARMPMPSPDGKSLLWRGVRGELNLRNLGSGETRTVLASWDFEVQASWSPDGRYLAWSVNDDDFNADIFIAPADGSAPPVNVTRHPDSDTNPVWSADGKILAFLSERVGEEMDVFAVYLDRDLEALNAEDLKNYYEEAEKSAKKREPLKVTPPRTRENSEAAEGDRAASGIEADEAKEGAEEEKEKEEAKAPDLDDAWLRVRRITRYSGNETGLLMTPGGERLIFGAQIDGGGLFSVKWDGSDRKSLGGSASLQHMSLTGEKTVLVAGGQAALGKTGAADRDAQPISARIRIDLQLQNSQKFLEAARGLGEGFYHPTMNGTDWQGLSKKYHALAMNTRTAEEFNWVGNRFIGELNGSHLAIRAPGGSNPNATAPGTIGTRHARTADGFVVTEVMPRSPAARGPMALQPGDVITAIELEPIGENQTVESRLMGRVGKETIFSIRRPRDGADALALEVLLTPISGGALRGLAYEAWRNGNRDLVDEWSGGKLGYIHIQGMDEASLDVFERDLYAAAHGKQGLLIDVRNNGGGWTADRLLSSIMVTPHAYTVPRGADPAVRGHYPQDRLFIQRYSLPINMLCNEKSYSNAEIISHAFKTLGRGTLVGQQTHGSVISTGGWSLIDGTFVRLPFRGWYVADGTNRDMELNGAMPDLVVPQTPEAECRGDDEQLRAAVEDLLKRTGP